MVKEQQVAGYACEKCKKVYLSKSVAIDHEKGCGQGFLVKAGDRVIEIWMNRVYRRKIHSISGKTVSVESATTGQPKELPVDYLRQYDENVVKELETFQAEIQKLEKQTETLESKFDETRRKLKPIFG